MARSTSNAEQWKRCKDAAYVKQFGRCQICNKRFRRSQMVGHHEINKSKGGKNTVGNCIMRCHRCEIAAHQRVKDGNPPIEWITLYREFLTTY